MFCACRGPASAIQRSVTALATTVLVVCLCPATAGAGDQRPGSISGRVGVARASPASPLALAPLRLSATDLEDSSRTASTDNDGRFIFTGLAPHRYELAVEAPGFRPHRQQVEVGPGAHVELEITLQPSFSDSVTVTATRSERRTEDVPAAVSVVGREQLEQTPMTNIKDALEGMPSTLVGSKNQGYDARLVIRGSGLKARYGIREIMVLLNGIPMTDPDSFTRLDFVDTQLVERVEVVRGPNSTLWGINATGGAINVITRSPGHEWGGSATADAGAYGARALQLNYSGAFSDRHSFSVDFSRRQADNDWRPHNEFETTQVTVQPWIVLGGDAVLENYISYTEADIQLPGWLVVNDDVDQWSPYLEHGTADETAEPWRHSGRTSDVLFLASRLRTSIGELRIEPLLFVNSWSHFHPVTGKINQADTVVGGLDAPAIWEHDLGTLTAGATARFDLQDSTAFTYADVVTSPTGQILSTASSEPGELMESTEQVTSLYGVYAQESFRPDQRWTLDVGLRVDRIRFDITGDELLAYDYRRGTYGPGAGAIDSVRSYTAVSPRVAAVLGLTKRLNLYASVSSGAQTPTSSELATNPDLELTRVLSYESGLKGRFEWLSFDSAIYRATVDDDVVQVIEGQGYTEYVNAGKTEKTGVELSLTALPWTGVAIGGSYAYSDFEYSDFSEPVRGRNIDRSGNRVPFVPEHQISLFASYHHYSGLSAHVSTNTWGEYFVDNANSETYEGFSLVTDLALGFRTERFDVKLMVQNLFDDRYAVEVQKDLYGSRRYAPAAPRSLRVRASVRF